MAVGYNLYNITPRVDAKKYFRKGDTISFEGNGYNIYHIKTISIGKSDTYALKFEMEYLCVNPLKGTAHLFTSKDMESFVRTKNLLLEIKLT